MADEQERNKIVLRRFFDEVVNAGRLEVADEVLAGDLAAGAKRVAAMWREAFPDLVLTVDDIVAEGDRVAATVSIAGTHTGTLRMSSFRDVAPTGRRATWTGMDHVRISNGKIVERRSPRDLLRMLQQIGAIEPRSDPGPTRLGRVVILNGPPRSGKSSIAAVIQDTFEGIWMNLGVDAFVERVTPKRLRPGMGLRPGGSEHPVAPLLPAFYAALYDSVSAHARAGLDVVVDVGHYDRPTLVDCARRLRGLDVVFVGVACPIEELMRRRAATWQQDADVLPYVQRWQDAIVRGPYDLELDTSRLTSAECAALIQERLHAPASTPSAFVRLAEEVGSERGE